MVLPMELSALRVFVRVAFGIGHETDRMERGGPPPHLRPAKVSTYIRTDASAL